MTARPNTPLYHAAAGGVWSRRGHASITPGADPNPPFGYDWLTNPYGVYDARDAGFRDAGGYKPDVTVPTCGIPTGITPGTTVSGTGGSHTLSSASTPKGGCTISATTNKVTLASHGLSNGHPIYFTSLTGGAGLAVFSAKRHENWYVVANATTNDFTLKKINPLTGAAADVDITTDYTAANLTAGLWYDEIDFTCYVTTTSSAEGLCLISQSKLRGPAAAVAGAQALVYNKPTSNIVFIVVDCEMTPDAPVAELDSAFGPNVWTFRNHCSHVTDAFGSLGGNHHFGDQAEKAAWFYPNPNHSDGSHCDMLMQIHYGDGHVAVGCSADGAVDSGASSTSDPSGHPIPTYTTSCVLVGAAAPIPTNLHLKNNDLKRGYTAVNIPGTANFANLGQVLGNQFHKADGSQPGFGPTRIIVTPNSVPASAITIHVNYPASGADANIDEAGAALTVSANGSGGIYAAGLGGNTTITWP